MFVTVTGGSGSGKSAFAEEQILKFPEKNRLYIATMVCFDEESRQRVKRHRKMRKEKHFDTLECPTDLVHVRIPKDTAVLLECMSNLVANEMFSGADIVSEDVVVGHILQGIKSLSAKVDELVIVSNNVFEDGISYDATTQAYIRALGRINTGVAALADTVTEVVVGIPVPVKERKEAGYAHH
mgnify:CR=1 FL=1